MLAPRMRLFSCLVLFSAAGLAACETAPPAPDAGAPIDAQTLEPSELFGECEVDAQCPGEGAICRHDDDGYPRGYCTVPCDDRTPCDAFGAYHHCTQLEGQDRRYCEQRCLNGLDCGRSGYTCEGELPPSGGVCVGVCSTDAHCSEGFACEPYSGRCYPTGMVPTAGAVTGEACDSDEACRSGACIEEVNEAGVPTGYLGGSCLSRCLLPTGWNSSSLFGGTVLPPGSCQGDAVCFPTSSYTEGDLGTCFPSCESDGDCRPGRECRRSFNTASGEVASFDNGICLPIDCSRDACPTGYRCVRVTYRDGSTGNVCGP